MIRQDAILGDIGDAAPHESLDRDDGVFRIVRLRCICLSTHHHASIGKVAHHRWQQRFALGVAQYFGRTATHCRDE